MNCLLKKFDIKIIKKFDDNQNFLNMSSNKNISLFRNEKYLDNSDTNYIVSNIVDNKGNILLEGYEDSMYIYSFEDPRFITKSKFTFCNPYFTKNMKLLGVKMGYFDLNTMDYDLYNLDKTCIEKNWQIHKRNIIYKIEPLEIYNSNYKLKVKNKYNPNWKYWWSKYGRPRLSTNVFTIEDKNYILYHSKIFLSKTKLQYFCGIAEVDEDYIPLNYNIKPLFPSFDNYEYNLRKDYIRWKSQTNKANEVDVLFPLNVEDNKNQIIIYSGINDCMCAEVTIEKKDLIDSIKLRDLIKLT